MKQPGSVLKVGLVLIVSALALGLSGRGLQGLICVCCDLTPQMEDCVRGDSKPAVSEASVSCCGGGEVAAQPGDAGQPAEDGRDEDGDGCCVAFDLGDFPLPRWSFTLDSASSELEVLIPEGRQLTLVECQVPSSSWPTGPPPDLPVRRALVERASVVLLI